MQRSVVVLGLALTLVISLTVLIFENSPREHASVIITTDSGGTGNNSALSPVITAGLESVEVGDLDKARDEFAKAYALDPHNSDIVLNMAQVEFRRNDFGAALKYFRQYKLLNPYKHESFSNLAITLFCQKQYGESENVIRESFRQIDGKSIGDLHFIYAAVLYKKGDTEAAATEFETAYDILGKTIFDYMDSHWFEDLQEVDEFRRVTDSSVTADDEPVEGQGTH
jgi:tetratricopeptide (TPR) repeat protein